MIKPRSGLCWTLDLLHGRVSLQKAAPTGQHRPSESRMGVLLLLTAAPSAVVAFGDGGAGARRTQPYSEDMRWSQRRGLG